MPCETGFEAMTRSLLRLVARLMIGVVLFAQLAVSAYACPALATAAGMDMPSLSASGPIVKAPMAMPAGAADCDDATGAMDPAAANLCAEHCKYGQQSDHAPTLNVPAAVLTALYAAPVVAPTAPPPRPAAAWTSALVAASPPLAVLHCVYRI